MRDREIIMGDYLSMTIERAARGRDLALAAAIMRDYDRAILAARAGGDCIAAARVANQQAAIEGEIGRDRAAAIAREIARIASEIGEIEHRSKIGRDRAIFGDPGSEGERRIR